MFGVRSKVHTSIEHLQNESSNDDMMRLKGKLLVDDNSPFPRDLLESKACKEAEELVLGIHSACRR